MLFWQSTPKGKYFFFIFYSEHLENSNLGERSTNRALLYDILKPVRKLWLKSNVAWMLFLITLKLFTSKISFGRKPTMRDVRQLDVVCQNHLYLQSELQLWHPNVWGTFFLKSVFQFITEHILNSLYCKQIEHHILLLLE